MTFICNHCKVDFYDRDMLKRHRERTTEFFECKHKACTASMRTEEGARKHWDDWHRDRYNSYCMTRVCKENGARYSRLKNEKDGARPRSRSRSAEDTNPCKRAKGRDRPYSGKKVEYQPREEAQAIGSLQRKGPLGETPKPNRAPKKAGTAPVVKDPAVVSSSSSSSSSSEESEEEAKSVDPAVPQKEGKGIEEDQGGINPSETGEGAITLRRPPPGVSGGIIVRRSVGCQTKGQCEAKETQTGKQEMTTVGCQVSTDLVDAGTAMPGPEGGAGPTVVVYEKGGDKRRLKISMEGPVTVRRFLARMQDSGNPKNVYVLESIGPEGETFKEVKDIDESIQVGPTSCIHFLIYKGC